MKPKKLIREKIRHKIKPDEWEIITDKDELNKLYVLKIKEELAEILDGNFNDINEFADLVQAVMGFAFINGFDSYLVNDAMFEKNRKNGKFTNIVLTNLNPENPSNKIYFENCINHENT
jgi:predicted house-cleaning noncanonical NTP pyrophosphatase (MazG superfamily)